MLQLKYPGISGSIISMRHLLVTLLVCSCWCDVAAQISVDHSEGGPDDPGRPQPEAEEPDPSVPQSLTPLPQGGTIIITSNRERARVVINNMELGSTPFVRTGFHPGFYNVEVSHDECRPFNKVVEVRQLDTVSIQAMLEPLDESRQYLSVPGSAPPRAAPVSGGIGYPGDHAVSSESPASSLTPKASLPSHHGAMNVSCNTDGATVIVNKVEAGTVPLFKGGLLPGYYEIEIKKDGFKPYHKMIQIKGNDTVFIDASLVSVMARLIIRCDPSGAEVILDDKNVGRTPFDSALIKPGSYSLRVEHEKYVPYTAVITLEKNTTDSLDLVLETEVFRDSVRNVRRRQSKIARRIIFGTLTAGFLSGGFYYNTEVVKRLENERSAWKDYQEPDLTGPEYDARYEKYEKVAAETDKNMKNRNVLYVLSIISAAGLSISIPF